MSAAGDHEGVYGYLAALKLCAAAAADKKLASRDVRVLTYLASFVHPDGTCCVSLSRVAETLGIKRELVQQGLRVAEERGYLTSVRRSRATGAEGAKVFSFNLDIVSEGLACPLPESKAEGVPPEQGAGGCPRNRGQGVPPEQGAHKRPYSETLKEETSACSARAPDPDRLRGGKTAGQQGRDRRTGQRHLLLPIDGGARDSPAGKRVEARVDLYNHDQRAAVSGRVMQQWVRLDGDDLIDFLGDGAERVIQRATDAEIKKRGSGCRYIAGAVERASKGRATVSQIMSGKWSQGPFVKRVFRMPRS